MIVKVGIMGGRLSNPIENRIQSFPKNSWRDEFETANKIGFDYLEWVFDNFEPNPIMNKEQIQEKKTIYLINYLRIELFKGYYFGLLSYKKNLYYKYHLKSPDYLDWSQTQVTQLLLKRQTFY